MPLIPALRRQRRVDFCEFEASLLYIASSRPARVMQSDPISKQNKNKQPKKHLAIKSKKVKYDFCSVVVTETNSWSA